ncbi:MAG: transcriptional repressor [Gemmatimonadota bacterium]|nr:transcriptional repressor [Gemmatimonadota bacterium]
MAVKEFQRNTRQRQVIQQQLQRLTSHPTAVELYGIVRRYLPRISLGTVYRNLELLARSGVIRKLDTSGSEARFDGDTKRHHHVRCACCGRVEDAHEVPADLVGDEYSSLNGYEIVDHRLEFIGICPGCRAKRSE